MPGAASARDRTFERNVAPGAALIDLSVSLGSHYNPLVRRMRELPKPIVCAVNGVAAGAGANIALACGIVLAARSASFVQSFARLGLVLDPGGTYFLPRLVGTARAMGSRFWPSRSAPRRPRAGDSSGRPSTTSA